MPARFSEHIRTGLLVLVFALIITAYFFYRSPVVQEGFATVFENFDEAPLWQKILLVTAIIILFGVFVFAVVVSVSAQATALTTGVRNVGTGVREAGSGLGNWLRGKGEASRANANVKRASIGSPAAAPA
jgi:hypothetical protein